MPKELIDDDCGRTSNCSCPRVRRAIGSMSGTPILNRAVLTGVVFVLHLVIAWNLLFQEMGRGSVRSAGGGLLRPGTSDKGGRHPYQFFTAEDAQTAEVIRGCRPAPQMDQRLDIRRATRKVLIGTLAAMR
jgi:hypothetical protein